MHDTGDETFVYCVSWKGTEDIVKIGKSSKLAKRFNTFLTAHPNELIVRCICNESIMTEADLHERHASARVTLEHFELTQGIQETIDMLNMSTGFTPYTIPRTKSQTGVMEDAPLIANLRQEISIPPLRLSPMEKCVAELMAIGMTVAESAETLSISESAIKTHRAGIQQKTFSPNGYASISKLYHHKILDIEKITE